MNAATNAIERQRHFRSTSSMRSLFEEDDEYPDLECRKPVVKRYLRLISSADYRSESFIDDAECDREVSALPHNLLTEGRRMTPALNLKILGALVICRVPSNFELRTFQLFHMTKLFGYRYNYKSHRWEQG